MSVGIVSRSGQAINTLKVYAANTWGSRLAERAKDSSLDGSWTAHFLNRGPNGIAIATLPSTTFEQLPAIFSNDVFSDLNMKIALIAAGEFTSDLLLERILDEELVARRIHSLAMHFNSLPSSADYNMSYDNLAPDIQEIFLSLAKAAVETLKFD